MALQSEFKYDVFISYRWVDPDQIWVRTQLKPALEEAGLKVLIDVVDFVPGRDLILEMTRGSTQSRRGVCVLSPDYVNDQGRMVNFESLMLRRLDPSGSYSRLIPLVIRKTTIPDHIQNLIAVDWTDASNHQREWTKLLNVLEAKNPKAPPPGPIGIASTPPAPTLPAPPPPKSAPRWSTFKVALMILAAVVTILAAFAYRGCGGRQLRTIEGRVYHQRAPGNAALIPVQNVFVVLKNNRDLSSEPTGSDGRFRLTIQGIPASTPIALEAKYGNQFYDMGYEEGGDYPVIPREIVDPYNFIFIDTRWVEAPNEPCLPDEGETPTNNKVFSLDVVLPGDQNGRQAVLTVELLDSPYTTIQSADVIGTPKQLYRNETIAGQDRRKSQTWLFQLPSSGLKTKLNVCLGSDRPNEKISQDKFKTHYKLQ